MHEYFEIKKFDQCSPYHWDKFCLKSDDCMVMGTLHMVFYPNHVCLITLIKVFASLIENQIKIKL